MDGRKGGASCPASASFSAWEQEGIPTVPKLGSVTNVMARGIKVHPSPPTGIEKAQAAMAEAITAASAPRSIISAPQYAALSVHRAKPQA